jgi:hypothetical protein
MLYAYSRIRFAASLMFLLCLFMFLQMASAFADGAVSVTHLTDTDYWVVLSGIIVTGITAVFKQPWMTPLFRVVILVFWSVVASLITAWLNGQLSDISDWFAVFAGVIITAVGIYHTVGATVLAQLESKTSSAEVSRPKKVAK